jgi:CubicO group peptidase (beta-lactamase class C family)
MPSKPRWPIRLFKSIFMLLIASFLALTGAMVYFDIPRNAAGMAAKGVCSAAFVAGRERASLMAQDVLPASPVLKLIRVHMDEAAHRVTASFAGAFERQATLLPNRGCVLDVAATSPVAPAHTVNTAPLPWPQGNAPVPPTQWPAGVNAAALNALADATFVGAGNPQAANARGMAIIYKGQLLLLKTAPGFAGETPLHGWSMTKTVNAMLMHKLSVDTVLDWETPIVNAFPKAREPAWLAQWRADERKHITLADALYMRDGLKNEEGYQPWSEVPKMLWGAPDTAAFAAAAPAAAPRGERWWYLSATSNVVSAVARGRFNSDADYWAYPSKALFNPIGATSAVMETDSAGNWVGSSYLWASTGDWARLGLLMLNDGRWGDAQVLPPGWLKRAATPSTSDGKGRAYGAQTWLPAHPEAGVCKGKGLPADTLFMSGHWGQVVAMVPSRQAVIVRLGWTFKREQFDNCGFVKAALNALPAS